MINLKIELLSILGKIPKSKEIIYKTIALFCISNNQSANTLNGNTFQCINKSYKVPRNKLDKKQMCKTKMNTVLKLYVISEYEDNIVENSNLSNLIYTFEIIPIKITK